MQNRKDLLQAHRLMAQRTSLALICGEPDSPNQPLRRLNIAAISSVLTGVIVAGVFGVLGLLAPGTVSGLTRPDTLVVDRDTATPYVPCENGKLCPALNYASALLTLDSPSVNKVDVSQASLSRYEIGPPIGIAGLPQDLPTPGNLIKGPWSVCTANDMSTLVGGRSVGGAALGRSDAVLVTSAEGGDWVVWNGERLVIQQRVMQTLFDTADLASVPVPWLEALPQGPDFAAPRIQGQGEPVTGPFGTQALAGQVYFERGGGGTATQSFVLGTDGRLATVSATQAQLLEREPAAPGPQEISPAMATSDLSGTAVPDNGLPAEVPPLAAVSSPLCVVYGAGLSRQITGGGVVPGGARPSDANDGVDQVWLPPDHGALVGAAPSVNQPSAVTAWFLVTGATRYALSSSTVAQVLGYHLSTSGTVLPASVLELLPQGPVMDPAAATVTALGG